MYSLGDTITGKYQSLRVHETSKWSCDGGGEAEAFFDDRCL